MKYKIVILLLILLVASLNMAYAGSERRLGTAGAQELRIPIGARGTSMGGAVIADVSGVESIHWNPAGLARTDGTEVMFNHQPYIADINVNFFGVASNLGNFGVLAGGVKIVSIGDIEETTEDAADGTGKIFSPSLTVLSLSYARQLTYNVSFGTSAKFINERILDVSASGLAFDIGFIYNPNWHGVSIGMSISNYGTPMRFSGRGFDQTVGGKQVRPLGASFDLPSSFNIGAAYNFWNMEKNSAMLCGNFISNNYSQDAWQGGFEYTYDGIYSLRAGYSYSSQESYLYGFSAGAGLTFDLSGTKVTFEYSWNQTDVFDNTQHLTGKVNF
jgi:hypothetical protein